MNLAIIYGIITGRAMEGVLQEVMGPQDRYRGMTSATGSAGTIASGDYLKQLYPDSKIVASEALQCPTLLENGFGAHRIEGIGDKHVPWVHNVKNTDMIVAIDDYAVVNLSRLFNQLDLLGFSGISNLLTSIKFSKYFELGKNDVVLTILTDSMELYGSRLQEMHDEFGEYKTTDAAAHFAQYLDGVTTDNMLELTYPERRRVHNLKYFTWVEQQGKTYEEIMDQWYKPDYWTSIQQLTPKIDEMIEEFNKDAGLQ
jgi:cysteine synthase